MPSGAVLAVRAASGARREDTQGVSRAQFGEEEGNRKLHHSHFSHCRLLVDQVQEVGYAVYVRLLLDNYPRQFDLIVHWHTCSYGMGQVREAGVPVLTVNPSQAHALDLCAGTCGHQSCRRLWHSGSGSEAGSMATTTSVRRWPMACSPPARAIPIDPGTWNRVWSSKWSAANMFSAQRVPR